MRRSAPHPAIRNTPRGGTIGEGGVSVGHYQTQSSEGRGGEGTLTEDGDDNDEDGRDWVRHFVDEIEEVDVEF